MLKFHVMIRKKLVFFFFFNWSIYFFIECLVSRTTLEVESNMQFFKFPPSIHIKNYNFTLVSAPPPNLTNLLIWICIVLLRKNRLTLFVPYYFLNKELPPPSSVFVCFEGVYLFIINNDCFKVIVWKKNNIFLIKLMKYISRN